MKSLIWGILIIVVLAMIGIIVSPTHLDLDKTIVIGEGDYVSDIITADGIIDNLKIKYAFNKRSDELVNIQPGSYVFSGRYTADEMIDVFVAGPQQVYEHVTILEGWSKYDIDSALASGGLIREGEYIAFVDDETRIQKLGEVYDFIGLAISERGNLSSLEGYLYPDTYYIDVSKDFLQQLLTLQLQAFYDKIWRPYGSDFREMTSYVRELGYGLRMSSYATLILASIVEKEEKVAMNKSPITSVFLNRLNEGMMIGADITLCYGLEKPYDFCTPEVIAQNLQDASNLYNTRALAGLPPTPIGNPSLETIQAVLNVNISPYFYYLHEPNGTIHMGKNLSEHNQNKANYLN